MVVAQFNPSMSAVRAFGLPAIQPSAFTIQPAIPGVVTSSMVTPSPVWQSLATLPGPHRAASPIHTSITARRERGAASEPSAAVTASALAVAGTLALGAEGCCGQHEGTFANTLIMGGGVLVAGCALVFAGAKIWEMAKDVLIDRRMAKITRQVERDLKAWPQMSTEQQLEMVQKWWERLVSVPYHVPALEEAFTSIAQKPGEYHDSVATFFLEKNYRRAYDHVAHVSAAMRQRLATVADDGSYNWRIASVLKAMSPAEQEQWIQKKVEESANQKELQNNLLKMMDSWSQDMPELFQRVQGHLLSFDPEDVGRFPHLCAALPKEAPEFRLKAYQSQLRHVLGSLEQTIQKETNNRKEGVERRNEELDRTLLKLSKLLEQAPGELIFSLDVNTLTENVLRIALEPYALPKSLITDNYVYPYAAIVPKTAFRVYLQLWGLMTPSAREAFQQRIPLLMKDIPESERR